MTLEELLAALAKLPEGSKFAEALKAIIAAKEAEISESADKMKTKSKEQKELEKTFKATQDKLAKIFDKLNIDEDDDIDEAIDNLGKTSKTKGDETLLKRLDKLDKTRKVEKEEFEKQLADERGKRHAATKRTELLKALNDNNASNPDDLIDILMGKVDIGDDDSLTFTDDKGTAVKIADGVKSWLTTRPNFIKNGQNPGASSGTSTDPLKTKTADGKELNFGASLAKQTADNSKAAFNAQTHFFGENG